MAVIFPLEEDHLAMAVPMQMVDPLVVIVPLMRIHNQAPSATRRTKTSLQLRRL